MTVYQVDKLMAEARRIAAEYRRATGRSLAISGEIAVADAIGLLGLEPAPATAEGYDVQRVSADGALERLQVKARAVFSDGRRPHRLGQLKLDKAWDGLLVVLMNEDYEALEIVAATRPAVEAALAEAKPNKRGTLSIGRLRAIGQVLWTREGGARPPPA
jgi:hypothetical protein